MINLLPESLHMAYTLAVLAAAVVMFIAGKIRSDLVALCSMLALTLAGIITPQEGFSGFANAIIFTTAGMFVISRSIVRTGLANVVSNRILSVAGKNTHVVYALIMLLAALIGSMVSNTGTVAIMMPIVVGMAMTLDESPSRFLMPLAFMSSIGGMFTLIGNSPNMVVNEIYVKAGYPSLKLFSFLPIGLVCFAFGMLVITPVTSYFLSRRKNEKTSARRGLTLKALADRYDFAGNMFRLTVPGDSPIVGERLADLRVPEHDGVYIQEIDRIDQRQGYFGFKHVREQQISPGPGTVIQRGDTLRVKGSKEQVEAMAERCRLVLLGPEDRTDYQDADRFVSIGICELVLMSSSRLVKRKVFESGLRDQFGLTVLSIHRGEKYVWQNIKDQVMEAGDALLVQGAWSDIGKLDEFSEDWVVVGRPREHAGAGRLQEKMPLVAIVLVLMIGVLALNVIPTVIAVLLAATVLTLGGCFRNMDEVYQAINWETLVMIASLLPMATAMEKTGVLDIVSGVMMEIGRDHGPMVALAVVYGVASFMNILISTTPVALLIAPVAMRIAVDLGHSPLPFLFAVATASSMCFASPFSTPSNALVMSAGRYTFMDYMRIGLPLQILMGVVMVFVLPWLFPF